MEKTISRVVGSRTPLAAEIRNCAIGADRNLSALLAEDRSVYESRFGNLTECQAATLSEFYDFLGGRSYDLVHALVGFDRDAAIEGRPATELLARLAKTGAKLILLAGDKTPLIEADQAPRANILFTLDRRGGRFGSFLKRLVDLLAGGHSLLLAYVKIAPQAPGPWMEELPSTVLVFPLGDVVFIPEGYESLDLNGNPIDLGFLAMESYAFILNRTYFIMVTEDSLFGAKMFGTKVSPVLVGGVPLLGAGAWRDPRSLIKPRTLEKYAQIDKTSPEFLRLDKANFRIPTAEIKEVSFQPKTWWKGVSAGGVPHSGSLSITRMDGSRREFRLLGSQDGALIEGVLRSVCPQVV